MTHCCDIRFQTHSITTRIKTCTSNLMKMLHRSSRLIPLQQGLRQAGGEPSSQVFKFQTHSITTRIKTNDFNHFDNSFNCSRLIPLQQGLRLWYIFPAALILCSSRLIPLQQGLRLYALPNTPFWCVPDSFHYNKD